MSAISPQTEVRLLKCPIESDNLNQMTFKSENEQYRFFNNLPHLEVDNFTYQRKASVIRYPAHIDSILEYNYVMYKNDNYSDKWFYAFITKMEYANDKMTYITIETDTYQTWMFNIEWKRSFVEREHVNDDTVGLHTMPEQLETGEYTSSGVTRLFDGTDTYIIIACSDAPDDPISVSPRAVKYFNGVFSGTENYMFRDYQGAGNFIKAMAGTGKMDAIVAVYLAPQSLFADLTINWTIVTVDDRYTFEFSKVPNSSRSANLNTSSNLTPPSTIDGYTPKNNKLKVHPYSYFYISNNVGNDVSFKYEDFINNTASFRTTGSLTPGCSIKCIPLNYKKISDTTTSIKSFNSGISVAKYPTCSWSNDAYTNWLTQNSVNLGYKAAGGAIGIVAGAALIATGAGAVAGAGMIAGGIGMIADDMKEVYQHSLTPDQAQGNANSGDVTFSAHKLEVVAYQMTIRNEFAKSIDSYFSAFGYKVNIYKLPNITGRKNWNYVKTNGANIQGDIPEEHLNKIKEMFNNGVTLWHNPSTYLDYSQDNSIV